MKYFILLKIIALITEIVSSPIFITTIVKEINSFNPIMQIINPNYP